MKRSLLKTVVFLSFICSFSISSAESGISSSEEFKITSESSSVTESSSAETEMTSNSDINESSSSLINEGDATETSTSSTEVPKEDEDDTDDVFFQSYYVSVIKPDVAIWESIDELQKGTTENILHQTFLVKEKITTEDEREFVLLINQRDEEIGYVLSDAVSSEVGEEGVWVSNNQFVSLKNNSIKIYKSFNWDLKLLEKDRYVETFHAKGIYHHFNGKNYLSLYDRDGKWVGYVESKDVVVANGRQGIFNSTDKYVVVSKKNYSIYQNFDWKVKNNTSKVMNNTYRVKGFYRHFNGFTYYSLYDGQGTWQGYVNKEAVRDTRNAQGDFIQSNKYVTVSKKNYPTYNNFKWDVRNQPGKLFEQTFRVKGYYHHVNGSVYYSLYDRNNTWYGYINKNAVTEGSGKQGGFIATNQYVTVTETNYDLWQNFSWKSRGKSVWLYQHTYQVKGKYNHFNGATYYSLYDNTGKWHGYLNSNGATVAPGKQGIWLSKYQKGIITKRNYDVWENFNWKKKGNTNSMYNKEYQIKGYYNHFNGATYYSLYDNAGNWQGYLNSNAVGFSRRASTYLGTSEERVVNHLKLHEYDNFYLGTGYRGLYGSPDPNYVMSPRGRPNGYGPGMNCAGFVAYAYREAGANLGKITQVSNEWGGPGNAYNWKMALTQNTDYSTFYSVNALLASGKAKKGDIIYFEPNYSLPGPDSHLGIFWGDSSSQNKFFHCPWPGVTISNIFSGTPYSKVYLFPL